MAGRLATAISIAPAPTPAPDHESPVRPILPPLVYLTVSLAFALSLAPSCDVAAQTAKNRFLGSWALQMHDGSAGWLKFSDDQQALKGELWTVGQPKAIREIQLTDGKLHFVRSCRLGAPEFAGGPPTGPRVDCQFVATIQDDRIRIQRQQLNEGDLSPVIHRGKRLPAMPEAPDLRRVQFGQPVQLFNGKNLEGWELSNPKQKNGWKAIDGELVNQTPKTTFEPYSRYGNLRTQRLFGDGRWKLEFNVPENGNSGVYVRGAYEAQVTTRDCEKMRGIRGVGAIFNRIAPTENAGKGGGEWQSYEITIVDRHATVVLNGRRVIDNQPVEGNTNGAFQADVTRPGPLYLQGDHTSVRYRNLTFEPVLTSKTN